MHIEYGHRSDRIRHVITVKVTTDNGAVYTKHCDLRRDALMSYTRPWRWLLKLYREMRRNLTSSTLIALEAPCLSVSSTTATRVSDALVERQWRQRRR